MLEKIGLPPKPSMRGSNWVVDASNCQGCSSQFSFINRKHHCRRCGGIFCGSCTQQRMILRGQGDSPVRICDPCKNLEEAARFESRNRNKTKASKGVSGLSSQKEDDLVLNESLVHQEKHFSSQKLVAGSSSVTHGRIIQTEGGGSEHYPSTDPSSEPDSPEKLREKALDEKKKYRVLKDEGKSEEAMRAYKRGKELERQAAALEISIRKNRRKASSSGIIDDTQDIKDHFKAASERITPSVNKKSKEKDDLSAELRELGWSDLDLHESEKKPATSTVEGELSSLIREISVNSSKLEPTSTSDRSQVLAHKKKALELKRAGNLSEAKEELKKAKILERKIEEEELLGGPDDSDDELSLLIRSMDAEPNKFDVGIDFENIPGLADDFDATGNFEVTDEDMEDPDMASALKSLGWVEESIDFRGNASSGPSEKDDGSYAAPKLKQRSKFTIQKELLDIKKKALTLRRDGRLDESEHELKKAKVLESELDVLNKSSTSGLASINMDIVDENDQVTDQDMHDPSYLALLKNMGWEDEQQASTSMHIPEPALPVVSNATAVASIPSAAQSSAYMIPGRSKNEIQRDLLVLKRKALSLRRQGETEAADEVLENTRLLEHQLQEHENLATKQAPYKQNQSNLTDKLTDLKTEQTANSPSQPADSPPNKSVITSQEILAHKRKAVALKREGKLNEAKEELRQAKLLERRVDEDTSENSAASFDAPIKEKVSPNPSSSRERFKLQQDSLAHKRQSLKLRREGKIAEAEAEFEIAKSLESRIQEMDSVNSVDDSSKGAVEVEDFLDPQLLSALHSIGFEELGTVSQHKEVPQNKDNNTVVVAAEPEAENLVERIRSEKLKAVNLKRAGKQTEALAALRRAKAYEKKLQGPFVHPNQEN